MPLVLDHHLVWNMIIYLAKQLLFFGLSANLRRIISPYTIGNRHSGAGESLIQSCGHNCIEIRSENFDFWLTVSIHIIRMLSGIPISVLVGFSLGGSRKWHILRIYIFIMYKGSKMKWKIVIWFKKAFLVTIQIYKHHCFSLHTSPSCSGCSHPRVDTSPFFCSFRWRMS